MKTNYNNLSSFEICAVIVAAIGLVLVRLGHSSLQRVLFEVSPRDVRSTAVAAAALVGAASVACVPPTLRAMRVDPVKGLRME